MKIREVKGWRDEGRSKGRDQKAEKMLKIEEMRRNLESKNKVEGGEEGNEKVY